MLCFGCPTARPTSKNDQYFKVNNVLHHPAIIIKRSIGTRSVNRETNYWNQIPLKLCLVLIALVKRFILDDVFLKYL